MRIDRRRRAVGAERHEVRSAGVTVMLVANLDCEAEWASAWPASGPALARRPAPISAAATTAAAIAGSLLRCLATGSEDALWLAAPLADSALAELEGLHRPRLLSGALEAIGASGAVLGWGETPALASLRRRLSEPRVAPGLAGAGVGLGGGLATPRSLLEAPAGDPRGLRAALLAIRPPEPAIAARANHRGLSLGLAQDQGWALPGACMLESLEAIEGHLAAGGAAAAPGERWVLKTPLSAAGRDRVHGRGRRLAEPGLRARCAALLGWQGSLRFEPWMPRLDDWGMVGLIEPEGPRALGLHRQLTDPLGRFKGLEFAPGAASIAQAGLELGLPAAAVTAIQAAFVEAGRVLKALGYRGAFGVDAWRHQGPDGQLLLQPLGEINARLTMGLVAQALIARLAPAAGWPRGRLRLRLGAARSLPPEATLLARTEGFAAWLEADGHAV